jgi:hypothetical protein
MPTKHILKVGSFEEKISKPEWILYICYGKIYVLSQNPEL